MSIFLERFVLPILAAGVVALIILNPLKWDLHQRASLLIAIVSLAYFVGHTLALNKSAAARIAPQATEVPKKTGDATTNGPNSPATTGDRDTINYNQPEQKPEPPKKKD